MHARLGNETKRIVVLERCRRPLVLCREVVEERHRWASEAAARVRAEARRVGARLLVFFLEVVDDALGASVLGVGAGYKDGFNHTLHAVAAALQDNPGADLALAIRELVAARRADQVPHGTLQIIHQASSELTCTLKRRQHHINRLTQEFQSHDLYKCQHSRNALDYLENGRPKRVRADRAVQDLHPHGDILLLGSLLSLLPTIPVLVAAVPSHLHEIRTKAYRDLKPIG